MSDVAGRVHSRRRESGAGGVRSAARSEGLHETRSRKPPGRESLLRAAAGLFAELGYDGVTTRQILEKAGVEAPSLYHHFSSKLGLYRAVLARASEPFLERFTRTAGELAQARGGSLRDRLAELVWTVFAGALENPEAVQLTLFEAHRLGTRRYDVLAVWERLRDVFTQTLDEGVATGRLRVPPGGTEAAANLLVGGLTAYLQLHALGKKRLLTRRLAREIADLFIGGLQARHEAT
jgi:AcrR family transcriptional regulator